MKKNNNTSWGGVADWYDELLETSSDTYQSKVIAPNLLRLMGMAPDCAKNAEKKIIDIACGQGFFSRLFASCGAFVVGSDISPELIEIAKKIEKESKTLDQKKEVIKYFVSNADQITDSIRKYEVLGEGSPENLFDIATIVLAIQNIENINGVFEQTSKILKKGGRLFLVLNHPAFRIPGESSWQWDVSTQKQYRRVDSYMSDIKKEIDMTPGIESKNKKNFTVSFHRPLQVYFKSLCKANFTVSRLEEWISHKNSQTGPRSKEEDRMRKEIPMFLCIEATKM